jgi:hypothetical protein
MRRPLSPDRLKAIIADFLIGWHQGGQVRHRRAELAWRARLERWRS